MNEKKALLGKKIRACRTSRGLTQAELVSGGEITRNLLSQIENGIASPSLSSLRYIADRLEVPVSYLISDDEDEFCFKKREMIADIHAAFKSKSYKSVIYKISSLPGKDDELAYMLAYSLFELGKEALMRGSLMSAEKMLTDALCETDNTVFDTDKIRYAAPMYLCVARNIQSPLLDFDRRSYENGLYSALDYEFYKYMTLDYAYPFTNEAYRIHMQAKLLIKERRYSEALPLLTSAAEQTKGDSYNAFLVFGIYSDLEQCYKELYDFENAYLYASKRMSLIEGFKT